MIRPTPARPGPTLGLCVAGDFSSHVNPLRGGRAGMGFHGIPAETSAQARSQESEPFFAGEFSRKDSPEAEACSSFCVSGTTLSRTHSGASAPEIIKYAMRVTTPLTLDWLAFSSDIIVTRLTEDTE